MHRFFVQGQCRTGEEVRLSPEEARHAAQTLRLAPGEAVELLDGRNLYAATLTRVDRREVRAAVSERLRDREPRIRVTLFQGLAKGDKLETVARQCTELGVYALQPLEMARCVPRPDRGRSEAQRERWQRVAREAAKQCGRARVPPVYAPARMDDPSLAPRWAEQGLIVVPWEEAERGSLREALAEARDSGEPLRLGLVIGPEGGITPDEIGQLRSLGAKAVTLGPRTLRTETAGAAALAAVLALRGEME